MSRGRKNQPPLINGKTIRNFLFFLGICFLAYLFMKNKVSPTKSSTPITEKMILNRTMEYYYNDVDSIAQSFEIPTSYLLALIVLECSGKKEVKPRFESHIYDQLVDARDHGKSFGSITNKQISDADNAALRNLASSWGPFQLMGYQCIELEVFVHHLRGEHSIFWGVYWIKKRYGKYLDKEKYGDAFHIHNTGRPIPLIGPHRTYDPNYVSRGLAYMEYFEKEINKLYN